MLPLYTYRRTSALEGCSYSYRHAAAPHVVDCEHVLFHQCLREKNNARVVSNRNMYVTFHDCDAA
jgi:hypothetical protein